MKALNKVTLMAFIALSFSGCVFIGGEHDFDGWEAQQRENIEAINRLTLSAEYSQVLSKLGEPDFTEAFIKDDNEFRVLYYRTQRKHSDDRTSKDETTPLVFKNEKLIGWGEKTLELAL